ncbi:Uncharacterised protein [Kingella negevensis]|uniref:Uncharacterized protein n=1 Tax=Kingella negevensis TaxID=1522312 RepID=A0A238HGX5_9NEIS|nr:Uncharacterised protein [Kingella negevensis]
MAYSIDLREKTLNCYKQCNKEQDPEKVAHYLARLAQFSDYQLVYLDETGLDTYFFHPYARSPKGEIVKTKISGRKYQRLS